MFEAELDILFLAQSTEMFPVISSMTILGRSSLTPAIESSAGEIRMAAPAGFPCGLSR